MRLFLRVALALLLAGLWPTIGSGKVTLTFYSREFGTYFPHAFVRITGATDAEPDKTLDINFGFTPKALTPGLMYRPVSGEILGADADYVKKSDAHLRLELSDAQYSTVLGVVDKWRNRPQPSYQLHSANCVFFVGDVARALGMEVDDSNSKMMTRPRSYIINLIRINPGIGTIVPGSRAERALERVTP